MVGIIGGKKSLSTASFEARQTNGLSQSRQQSWSSRKNWMVLPTQTFEPTLKPTLNKMVAS